MRKWSKYFDRCSECKSIEYRHCAKGLCIKCYLKKYRNDTRNIDRIKECKRIWYSKEDKRIQYKRYRENIYFNDMREVALKRDSYKCIKCGSEDKLIVHHIDGNGRGNSNPNNTLNNLATLCRSCHAKIHGHPEKWARKWDKCRLCKSTTKKHNAKGYCTLCYAKLFQSK